MVHDSSESENAPDLEAVLNALGDSTCRMIIAEIDNPMTATELSAACDIPLSTVYRKLDTLCEVSLLSKVTDIQESGGHTTKYRIAFEKLTMEQTENNEIIVSITRTPETTADQLLRMWSEVSEEL